MTTTNANAHYLPNHATISEYARIKRVNRLTVYNRIEKGDIVPDIVGKEEIMMIDLDKYLAFEFKKHIYPRTTRPVKIHNTEI